MPDIGLFGSPVGIISGHSQIGRGKITVVKYADPEITFNQISERQAGTETEIAGFTEGHHRQPQFSGRRRRFGRGGFKVRITTTSPRPLRIPLHNIAMRDMPECGISRSGGGLLIVALRRI